MKESEQLEAIAEIDGWKSTEHWQTKEPPFVMWSKKGEISHRWFHFKFISSRDEIINVILKQQNWVWISISEHIKKSGFTAPLFLTSPQMLCEGLLKALGKWKD